MTGMPMLPPSWPKDLNALVQASVARVKKVDWLTYAWICAIPFMLLWDCVVAVASFLNDYVNPPFIRNWFGDRFLGPNVKLIAGFIPYYRPRRKWDAQN